MKKLIIVILIEKRSKYSIKYLILKLFYLFFNIIFIIFIKNNII